MFDFYYTVNYDIHYDPNSFHVSLYGTIIPMQYRDFPDNSNLSNVTDPRLRRFGFINEYGVWVDHIWKNDIVGDCYEMSVKMHANLQFHCAPTGGQCDLVDCFTGTMYIETCGDAFATCPDVVDPCDTLGVSSNTLQLTSMFAPLTEGTNNVLTINGQAYAGTATADVATAAAEIQSGLASVYPTIQISYANDEITVTGIPTVVSISWTNSTVPDGVELLQNGECSVLVLTPENAETVIVSDPNGVEIFNGDPSIDGTFAIPSGTITVLGGLIYISSCNTGYTPPAVFTISAQNPSAGCAPVQVSATMEQPAPRPNKAFGSTLVDLKEGTYTQADILGILAANAGFLMSNGSGLNASNAYIKEWSIGQITIGGQYFDTVAAARQATGNAGGQITDNGFTGALNMGGSRMIGLRNIHQNMSVTVDPDAAISLVVIVEERIQYDLLFFIHNFLSLVGGLMSPTY